MPPCGRGPYSSTNSRPARTARRAVESCLMCSRCRHRRSRSITRRKACRQEGLQNRWQGLRLESAKCTSHPGRSQQKKSACCAGAGPRAAATHMGTTSPAMRGAAARLPPLAAAPCTEIGVVDFEPGVFPDRWWFADTLGWHASVASDERPRGTRGYSTWLGDGWDESPSRIP